MIVGRPRAECGTNVSKPTEAENHDSRRILRRYVGDSPAKRRVRVGPKPERAEREAAISPMRGIRSLLASEIFPARMVKLPDSSAARSSAIVLAHEV